MIDPIKHKQLFLDDHAVQDINGLGRILHQPDKQEPVIRPDKSRDQSIVQSESPPLWNPEERIWEWWYTAFYDDAPYQGPGNTVWADYHYAISNDGVNWEQSPLGLYNWRWSRENNIAYHSKLDFLRRRGIKSPVDIQEMLICTHFGLRNSHKRALYPYVMLA